MGKKRKRSRSKNKKNKNKLKKRVNINVANINPKIIGRTDILNFPSIGLKYVDVKIDTGAYTSSIHCEDYHIEWIPFVGKVLIVDFGNDKVKLFSKFNKREVTSSNGQKQQRYLVMIGIEILGESWKIPVTLNNRSSMKYKCLLGRTFLSPCKLLVDVRELNLSIDNVYNLFKGIEDLTLYHKGSVVRGFDTVDDMFNFIKTILYHKISKFDDFKSIEYLKRISDYYIINDNHKITLKQISSFIYKTRKGWKIKGYSKFKNKKQIENVHN